MSSPVILELGDRCHVVRRGDVVIAATKDREVGMISAINASAEDGSHQVWIQAGPTMPRVMAFEDLLRAILARPP